MIQNLSLLDLSDVWPLGFMMPGGQELFFILIIVLVLFGGAKLPSLMRNLGRSANEFKRGMSESTEDEDGPGDAEKDRV